MALSSRLKARTLMTRELQEYRVSLVITPAVVGAALLLMMLASVLFAGRLSSIGSGWMNVLDGESAGGFVIEVNIDENEDGVVSGQDEAPDASARTAEPLQELIIAEGPADIQEEAWNFSQEWTFSPPVRDKGAGGDRIEVESLNPLLNGMNSIFLLLMFILSLLYFSGCLYQDRKDKSILFWKSMPVSEWEEVLSKLAVGTVVVPLVYLVVSLVTQMLAILVAMLMVWRLDGAPVELVISNIQFIPLVLNQVSGSFIWMLFLVPVYAWFMLAGAVVKRYPFLAAAGVPIALMLVEKIFIGSDYVLRTVGTYLPRHMDGNDAASLGFYEYGPVWSSINYVAIVLGFAFTGLMVAAAAWFRRYRFEA